MDFSWVTDRLATGAAINGPEVSLGLAGSEMPLPIADAANPVAIATNPERAFCVGMSGSAFLPEASGQSQWSTPMYLESRSFSGYLIEFSFASPTTSTGFSATISAYVGVFFIEGMIAFAGGFRGIGCCDATLSQASSCFRNGYYGKGTIGLFSLAEQIGSDRCEKSEHGGLSRQLQAKDLFSFFIGSVDGPSIDSLNAIKRDASDFVLNDHYCYSRPTCVGSSMHGETNVALSIKKTGGPRGEERVYG